MIEKEWNIPVVDRGNKYIYVQENWASTVYTKVLERGKNNSVKELH